ncbi:hypothetical protein CIB95_08345 [Lottiidibacillus patelloidae]|uniref:Uncharacterized protein n=1 Tax=Lottiidibacillus patelloidae TaxID=2670334 RepID=A0A263BUP6_9BACI|nr:DUF4878 domain-containing protein [Lottiidibacillus patelloidae]OZM57454.1 hypothetical protein CIB95_08345 [Lottiidibacillus patelloidae]
MKKLVVMMTLLFMTVVLMACNNQDSPEATAELYLKSMKKQDIKAMVSLLDQEHLQEIADYLGTTIEEMTETAEASKNDKILHSYEMGSTEDGEDGRKIVNVTVTIVVDGMATEKEAQIQLLKRDDKWWVISENL